MLKRASRLKASRCMKNMQQVKQTRVLVDARTLEHANDARLLHRLVYRRASVYSGI